ncbi:hypothetical protein MK852_01370 [Shewanella benthica]|nr:hypothetical protein [Shewanella benthica]
MIQGSSIKAGVSLIILLLLAACQSEVYELQGCDDSKLQAAPPTLEAINQIKLAMSEHHGALESLDETDKQAWRQEAALLNRTFFCEAGYSLSRTYEAFYDDKWEDEPKYAPLRQFDGLFILGAYLIQDDMDKALELGIINQATYSEIKLWQDAEFTEITSD